MKAIASELNKIIEDHLSALRSVRPGKIFISNSLPRNGARKKSLGHLVDSAQNNIRRFIVAQYDERPKIVYNQDKWVAITNYQQYPLTDLINLWYQLNKHICQVLTFMPTEMSKRLSSNRGIA